MSENRQRGVRRWLRDRRFRALLPLHAEPRSALRRLLRRGREVHRRVLPAELPGPPALPPQRPAVPRRGRRADRGLPRVQALRPRRRAGLAGLEPACRSGGARRAPDRRRRGGSRRRRRARRAPPLLGAPAESHTRGRAGRRPGRAGARPAGAVGAHADRDDRAAVRRGGRGRGLRQHQAVQRDPAGDLRPDADRAAQPRTRGRRPAATPGAIELRLPAREPFDGVSLVGFLAERAVPGVEEVAGGTYRRMLAPAARQRGRLR